MKTKFFGSDARTPNLSSVEPLESRIAPAAAVIDLGDIDGSNGFVMNGVGAGDFVGASISSAGDVNGDGLTDLLLVKDGYMNPAESYVVFGQAGARTSPFELSAIDGTNGFKILGDAGDGSFGRSVDGVGDFNGDGFDDIVIGAPGFASNGAAYVIFGHGGAFAATFDAGGLTGADGFKMIGEAGNNSFGHSVSSAGDLNGDGFDDVIIGAQFATATFHESGASYVIFGGLSKTTAVLDLTTLDGTNGVKIVGAPAREHSGASVSAAGDVNGDGFDDVIIGAPFAPTTAGSYSGASYVVYGKDTGFSAQFALASIDGTNGFKIAGEVLQDFSGDAVSGLGDVNGDGFDDVAVGAWQSEANGTDSGSAYVVFGSASRTSAQLDLASLNGANGFKLRGEAPGDRAGRDVSAAGDVNGDGFDDILVGAYMANTNGDDSGAAYVVFGKATGFTTELLLADIDGMNGFTIQGALAGDRVGRGLDEVGDVNGDGLDDVLVGAAGVDTNGNFSGAAYLVQGIGPAVSLAKNGRSAVLPDADGDVLTVKVTKGTLDRSDFVFAADGSLDVLMLNDDGDEFRGAGVTITVKKGPAGDGMFHVNCIVADGIDLGAVKVAGSLGLIRAGDANLRTPGVKSLTVAHLGESATTWLATPRDLALITGFRSEIAGSLGALTVNGDMSIAFLNVTGGTFGNIGKITIAGDLLAGLPSTATGLIRASGNIGPVKIGGSVSGGAELSGIMAGGKLGKVTIGGDLESPDAAHPVLISALGKLGAKKAADAKAISGVTVKGNVANANILAGFTMSLGALNPDAAIGKVMVGGNWTASSLVAGVTDATDDGFGQNDALIGGDTTPTLLATIASITIKGAATGSAAAGDHFGITAQRVLKLKIGPTASVLTNTANDLILDAANYDFRIVDFA